MPPWSDSATKRTADEAGLRNEERTSCADLESWFICRFKRKSTALQCISKILPAHALVARVLGTTLPNRAIPFDNVTHYVSHYCHAIRQHPPAPGHAPTQGLATRREDGRITGAGPRHRTHCPGKSRNRARFNRRTSLLARKRLLEIGFCRELISYLKNEGGIELPCHL